MRIAELDRINQLAQKAKTTPLSTAEQQEREQLRQSEYSPPIHHPFA